jgi:hypothetical protein
MLEIDPGVRVLFSSGYFADELTEREDRIVGFIQKPYRQEELAKTVRAALEQVRVPRRDVLLMLVKRLEQALAPDWVGNEGPWFERLLLVLDRVEQATRQQLLDVDSPDGPLDEFRKTPSQDRRMKVVHARYADFVQQAMALKKDLQKLSQAFYSITQDPSERLGLPEPDEEPVRLDVATIRQRADRFRRELEKHRQDEINLILESVTTDIGGGD